MDTDLNSITVELVTAAYPTVKEVAENHANNLYKARKEIAASVCRTEHERQTVIDAEDAIYELNQNGVSYTLSEKQEEESLAVKLVNDGKENPTTKGPNGTVTDITGEQIPAKSYVEGYEVDYGWSATHFKEETNTMLETTEPELIGDNFSSYAESNGGEIVSPYIYKQIQNQFGGDK